MRFASLKPISGEGLYSAKENEHLSMLGRDSTEAPP